MPNSFKISSGFNPITSGPEQDTAMLDAVIEQAHWMDEAGLACIYTTEHHFTGYGAHSNNFMISSYLAGQLEQAYVGFSICVVPLHHPARLAEMANLLDQLTKGRFIFGLGGGGIPLEFAGYGLHAADSTELHDEVFDVVMQLWDKAPDDPPIEFNVRDIYQGTLYQRIMPAPFREGGPLIKLACTSPARLDKAARYGWSGYVFGPMLPIFEQKLAEYGHSPERIDAALEWTSSGANIVVAETDEEAKAQALTMMSARVASTEPYQALVDQHLGWMRKREMPNRGSGPGAVEAQLRGVHYGSPQTVFEQLRDILDMGYREINVGCDLGTYEDAAGIDATKRSLRLFLDEVMPLLDGYVPDRARGAELLANMPAPPMMAGPPPADGDARPPGAGPGGNGDHGSVGDFEAQSAR